MTRCAEIIRRVRVKQTLPGRYRVRSSRTREGNKTLVTSKRIVATFSSAHPEGPEGGYLIAESQSRTFLDL